MRGDGRIFKKRGSQFWHYEFWLDGRAHRGSTGELDEQRASQALRRKRDAARRGDAVPGEDKVRLGGPPQTREKEPARGTLYALLDANYRKRRNRSLETMRCSFRHLTDYFGETARAVKLGAGLDAYVEHRRGEEAAEGSIRIELALLDRAFRLAVQSRLLSHRARPYIEKPPVDEGAVRQGFFRRETIERLCAQLPSVLADVVLFLFFCPWRIGAARRLEWRDYSAAEQALTLRPELNKTKRPLCIPVDPENTPELMAVIERQRARRRPECPFIFHGRGCGAARVDRQGRQRPCLGDFGKTWDRACAAIGMAGRIPHDLRRSGVKHYIDAGVDPHTVMRWSGHRTTSMLQRYHIIDLDDLRRSGKRASDYRGPQDNVVRGDFGRTRAVPAQDNGFSSPSADVVAGPQLS
jgi:integrase